MIISNPLLQKVALEYAENITESGDLSQPNVDTNDTTPSQRISKVMRWSKMAGECIAVGSKSASDIVASLIIDDGDSDRSNRKVIFNENARLGGVICIPHSVFGVLTVIDLVGGVYENPTVTGQY